MRLEGWELVGSLSADGLLLLAGTGSEDVHGVAIADVRNGLTWQLPVSGSYAWAAWSYDDIALVTVALDGGQGPLLSCRVATTRCEPLPQQGSVLLPTT